MGLVFPRHIQTKGVGRGRSRNTYHLVQSGVLGAMLFRLAGTVVKERLVFTAVWRESKLGIVTGTYFPKS